MTAKRTETENTPRAFIDHIRRSIRPERPPPWERETLSSLLGLPKVVRCPECGAVRPGNGDTVMDMTRAKHDQVDDAVRAPRPRSYRVGWDTIMPDPGEIESWDCRVCGDACDVRRGVVGRTSSTSPHERAHDSFTCPNAGEGWHDRAHKLRQAIEDMPSPSVRALMEGDLLILLEGRT